MEMILEKLLKGTSAKSSVVSNAGINVAFVAFMGLLVFMKAGQGEMSAWINACVITCLILMTAGMLSAFFAQISRNMS